MTEHDKREDEITTMMVADLEYKLQVGMRMTHGDNVCARYLIENRPRLLPTFIDAARTNNEEVDDVIARFIHGVHQRHLAKGDLS